MAVMINASPTGPATLSMEAWPASADRDQRVVDAQHRTEQSDERRGGADRSEHRQAGLHAADDGVRGSLQRLGNPLAGADGAREPASC